MSLTDLTNVLTGLVARGIFIWRHTAHVLVGAAAAFIASHYGLHVPDAAATWAETALFALGTAAVGWVQYWLETRTGSGWLARAARFLARVLVLGAPAQPVYVAS